MSKEAALRAMREARYSERNAKPAPAATTRAKPAARTPKSQASKPAVAAETRSTDALCGHRSMNGRSCTREQGHAAKSHRYG